MHSPDADRAWRVVGDADPSVMCRGELSEFLATIERVRSACDAAEVLAVRRSRVLEAAGASEAPEAVLAQNTARTDRAAKAAAGREIACAAVPEFEAALFEGEMSGAHVDAAASILRRCEPAVAEEFAVHADRLVGRAGKVGVEQFGRECRDLARHLAATTADADDAAELDRQRAASTVKRWVDRASGMHHTMLSLDPLRDAEVWQVINAQIGTARQRNQREAVRHVSWMQLQVDAVVEVITGGTRESPQRTVPQVNVLIDWQRLISDAATAGVCETADGVPLPVATVRRLCCDAEVLPTVLGGSGEVLDHGRRRRTASPQQRDALAAMHRTCAYPGCSAGFDATRIHHVRWWWRHLGPTDIDNLLPLCERHHHLVHEGGWKLTMNPDRVATWTRPDGVEHHVGPTIDRRLTDEPP